MGQEITLTASDGGRFAAYLALPARLPAPGLVVLPEVFNTNPHIRSVADGYAADGFIALAPDVFWRQEAANYLPYTDEGRAKARALWAELDTDQFARDLGDMVAALRARADCTGKIGVMGFCLGGKFAYLASTRLPIEAAVSYYGVQIDQHLDEADRREVPDPDAFRRERSACAGADRGGDPGAPGRADGVEIHVYPGTEHGFNRQGYPPYNEAAAVQARQRTLAHLRRLLS